MESFVLPREKAVAVWKFCKSFNNLDAQMAVFGLEMNLLSNDGSVVPISEQLAKEIATVRPDIYDHLERTI